MHQLKDKRLLILGGNMLSCDIVRAAREYGIYTIVTDWNPIEISPAKLIADEYADISLMDFDKLLLYIKEKQIDGIITGFTDSYLLPYQHLCELAGLPCYATREQFEKTLDKDIFKSICRRYGIPVVPQYDVSTFDSNKLSNEYKVIIKPVDNSGSRGICICDNADTYERQLEWSLSYSEKRKVIIERYMTCDDVSFEYIIQDGKVMLSSICDRYIYKTEAFGSVTSGLIYPSKYLKAYIEGYDAKVRLMLEGMQLENGVLFLQAFVENGQFYFYEMGYRLSGGRHYIFTKNQNGIAATDALISFALTGKMGYSDLSERIDPCFKQYCCQLCVLCESEQIHSIEGLNEISLIEGVLDVSCGYKVGDIIGAAGTTAQIFARIHIVAHSMADLNVKLNAIRRLLVVKNVQEKNIVIDFFM